MPTPKAPWPQAATAPHLEQLPPLESGRPLLVCDADEVLFHFMRGFERFLARTGEHRFEFNSFAITGNLFHQVTGEALDQSAVKSVLDAFFASETRLLDPVEGAADMLSALAEDAQILILSNVPQAQADDRRHALSSHGMDYPLLAHSGMKGPMVRTLMDQVDAPVAFVDDLPHQIDSVKEHAPDATCVHFVADDRLAKLVPSPSQPHHRARDWSHARELIGNALFV